MRFFTAGPHLGAAARLFVGDGGSGLVVVAGDDERIVAHAGYMRESAERAEVAFEVADDWQGRGIATVLLAHLAELAHTR